MQRKLTPFDVEKMRAALAEGEELDKLREMYLERYPQIIDQNTPTLWDRLNLDEKLLYAFHTLHKVKSTIARYSVVKRWKPNNVIILAQKPDSLSCRDVHLSI